MSSQRWFAVVIPLALSTAWGQSGYPGEYRNTDPKVAYTGTQSCSGSRCHDEICRNYPQTPMGHSMAPANTAAELEKVPKLITVYNPKVDRYFEVFRKGPELYQSEYQIDENEQTVFKATYRLDYVVGGSHTGFTYLFRRGQWLFEAPLSYYSETKQWEPSPGYGKADIGFTRPISVDCLACHNGQPEPVPRRTGMYQDPPFRFGELAIGCECCHGPGQLHVQEMARRRRQHPSKPDTSIVNPARISPRLADDICMFCHQWGDARILQPGKDYMDFRPGTPFYQTLALFRRPLREDQRAEADRLETLPPVRGSMETPLWWKNSLVRMSKCYQASDGRLTCITCHSIHHPSTPENRVAYYRDKCLTCHREASCKLPVAERMRQQPANDCVGCHMPKREVAGIAHSSDTNHRIVRHAGQPLPDTAFEQPTADLPGLLCLNKPKDSANEPIPLVTKLNAYAELMGKDPSLREYGLALMEQLSHPAPADAKVLFRLGVNALFSNQDNAGAVGYLSQALESGSEDPTTFLYLAEALSRTGRTEEAAKILERGVAAYPYVPPLRAMLAVQYLKMDQDERAREVMNRHLELFPEDSVMRRLRQNVGGQAP